VNYALAAKAYAKVGLETGVSSADPHQLILMLYDGAMLQVKKAQHNLQARDIAGKGQAASKAIQIIEEGLRASLDRKVGGAIAMQLDSLYEYMCHRLLLANMGNDPIGFSEVGQLLSDLRDAWASMGEKQAAAKPQPAMRLV
jgi:flagellar protein FliS